MWPWLLATIAAASWSTGWAAPPRKKPAPRPSSDQAAETISPTSVGPTSAAEAEILWADGKKAFGERRYHDATVLLARLVDRYPGNKGYLDAHRMLGTAWLRLGEPSRAVAPLRYFIDALGASQEADGARVLLGQALLGEEKYPEADLLAGEIIRLSESRAKGAPATLTHAQGLLLKAQSLVGLGRDGDSQRSLRSANGLLGPAKKDSLAPARAQAAYVGLTLKSRECARLPSAKILAEDQARDQIDRRGDCVADLVPFFHDAIKTGQEDWVAPASRELLGAIAGFKRVCAHPPGPTPSAEGKRTKKQLREYEAELAGLLAKDCGEREKRALEVLRAWKGEVPKNFASYYSPVEKTLSEER